MRTDLWGRGHGANPSSKMEKTAEIELSDCYCRRPEQDMQTHIGVHAQPFLRSDILKDGGGAMFVGRPRIFLRTETQSDTSVFQPSEHRGTRPV